MAKTKAKTVKKHRIDEELEKVNKMFDKETDQALKLFKTLDDYTNFSRNLSRKVVKSKLYDAHR